MATLVVNDDLLAKVERFAVDRSSVPFYKVDNRTLIRRGKSVKMNEVNAMRLVRKKTSIPVPEVYQAYIEQDTGYGCVVMELVDGEPLDLAWESLIPDQQEHIVGQLKGYMEELHSIEGSTIGSVEGGPCPDHFFDQDPIPLAGPFASASDFRDGLIKTVRENEQGPFTETVVSYLRLLPDTKIVLTHGDFQPRNILVRDGKVVSIIDWEYSGFYPVYWEYHKAMYRPEWNCHWMANGTVDKIMQPRPMELAIMMHTNEIVW